MFLQCVFIVIIIVLLVSNRRSSRSFLKLHKQLGNDFAYYPIIGNALTLLGNNEGRMKRIMEAAFSCNKREYKAISGWVGHIYFVVLNDVNHANVVLKSALDKNFMYVFTKELIGNGSVFAPVKIWYPRRKVLNPIFATRYIRKFVTIYEGQSKTAADLLEAQVGKGDFSVFRYLTLYALDTACETVFGKKMEFQRQRQNSKLKILEGSFKITLERFCNPLLYIDVIYRLLPMRRKNIHLSKTGFDFIEDLIEESINKKTRLCEEEVKSTEETNKSQDERKDNFNTFLDLLQKYSNNTYTREELREEVMVIIGASSDTATATLGFTIVMLAYHPDVQDRVYKEIQQVLGDSGKPLQAEELLQLKYTRAVIKETLRLYPPVPLIIRYCERDHELPNGIVLPEGTNVLLNIWGMQRNPEHWGEDADDFKPDRFLSGQIPTPNAFMAFSNGPRNCVGQNHAMLSITSFLVTFLRRYRILPAKNLQHDKKNPFRLSFNLILKDVNKFTIQIEYRDKC